MDDELRALVIAQARLIADLSERIAPSRAQVPVKQLFQEYEIAQKHRRGWRTAKAMVAPVVSMLADRDAASLTVADWTAYRVSRPALAPSSLNFTMRMLKAMLRWAKVEGLLTAVPALCDARKQPAKAHRETAPTEDDVSRLLGEATRVRDRYIVLAACDAGLRNTEIRLLEWSWIDRSRREIRLPASITKSRRSRVVPITKRLMGAIDAMPRDIRSPLVMMSPTGGPYSQEWVTRLWHGVCDLADIQAAPGEGKVRLHDGRHGFATNAAERGVRIEVLSEILGHASLEQTRAYVQHRRGDLDVARELFEAGIARNKSR